MSNEKSDLFLKRVENLMKKQFLRKSDMARLLNVDYSTFWRKLNGERNVDIDFIIRLSEVLGTSVAYLMGETDNPAPNVNEIIIVPATEPEGKNKSKLSLSYWGEVADNIRELASNGNLEEISLVYPLLKSGFDMLSHVHISVKDSGDSKSPDVDMSNWNHNNFTGHVNIATVSQ